MRKRSALRSTARWLAFGAGVAAGGYAAWAGVAWRRYGHPALPAHPGEQDDLLDRFMPAYDIVDRHHIRVRAPSDVTFQTAQEIDLFHPPIARAIFRLRELLLGAAPDDGSRPEGLLGAMQSIGWRILADVPGREVVVGAATKPWEPNPVFRGIAPEAFADFREPGYVKIAWTLRADPDDAGGSIFRTETRAVATDIDAATTFRRYWALLSPGIILIRYAMLTPLKKEAERRAGADTGQS